MTWARTWWRRWRTTTSTVWTQSAPWPWRMLMFKWLLCQVTRPMYSLMTSLISQVTHIRARVFDWLCSIFATTTKPATCFKLFQARVIMWHVRNTYTWIFTFSQCYAHIAWLPSHNILWIITGTRLFSFSSNVTISKLSRSNGFFVAID